MKNVYSMWLIPEDKRGSKFRQIIKNLSLKHKTPYFEPHVTLLGEIASSEDEAIKKTNKLAKNISYIPIILDKISFSASYFESVFVKAKKNKELMKANDKAQKIFKTYTNGYAPHMSLMYSNMSLSMKKDVANRLKKTKLRGKFIAKELHLYSIEGRVEDWKRIVSVRISDNSDLK